MKKIWSLIIPALVLFSCKENDKTQVVATSTWTAAYVRAAGVGEVHVLAPAEMQHPTEYELNIDDIDRIRNARLIVCGGYEVMMDRIRNGLNIGPDRILEIRTDYSMDHIRNSVYDIASIMGTESTAEKNLVEIEKTFSESKARIHAAGIDMHPVIVQFFIQPVAREMQLDIAAVFGPRPLEAYDIRDLMRVGFSMVLDNAHNPVSAPLLESGKDVRVAYLINFPGTGGTESISDVIRYNTDRILEAWKAEK